MTVYDPLQNTALSGVQSFQPRNVNLHGLDTYEHYVKLICAAKLFPFQKIFLKTTAKEIYFSTHLKQNY